MPPEIHEIAERCARRVKRRIRVEPCLERKRRFGDVHPGNRDSARIQRVLDGAFKSHHRVRKIELERDALALEERGTRG